jgi:hypothetical protein
VSRAPSPPSSSSSSSSSAASASAAALRAQISRVFAQGAAQSAAGEASDGEGSSEAAASDGDGGGGGGRGGSSGGGGGGGGGAHVPGSAGFAAAVHLFHRRRNPGLHLHLALSRAGGQQQFRTQTRGMREGAPLSQIRLQTQREVELDQNRRRLGWLRHRESRNARQDKRQNSKVHRVHPH